MNRQTECYVGRVKEITKQILKYQKECKSVAAGIKDTGSKDFKYFRDFANEERESKLQELNKKIAELEDELFRIKYVAFHKATKLSKSAKNLGFLSNKAYIEYEAQERGYTLWDLEQSEQIGLTNINYYEVYHKMSEKGANKISRR